MSPSDRREPPLRAPPPPEEPPRPALRAERGTGGRADGSGAGRGRRRRGVLVCLVGLVCVLAGLWDLSGRGGVNPAVPPALAAAEEIAVATATVYVALRVINAALSAAQEVEIGASVGAQASLQPLKVLEPVDDTVERVATVVFAVATGAALVLVGLEPVAAIGLVVLGVGLLGLGGAGIGGAGIGGAGIGGAGMAGRASVAAAGLRAVRLGAALGLVLPLVFAGGVWLGERATASQWEAAMARLEAVAGEAQVLVGAAEAPGAEAPPDGMIAGFLSAITDARDAAQAYVAAAGVFTREADALFSATLTIIGIFVLRSLVLPGLLLWSVMVMLRRSMG